MEKESQDKYRAALISKYEENAWECFANYSYWGERYTKLEKEINIYHDRIEEINREIAVILAREDAHTKEHRDKVAAFRNDVRQYGERIKIAEKPLEQLQKKAASWREQGVTQLEIAEYMKTFKVRTPEEIKANNEKNEQ